MDLNEELRVTDRLLQIPFLPHWRVPEFLRSCLAVCCLEQDFPITFHTPMLAREVLTCGQCLVGSPRRVPASPCNVEADFDVVGLLRECRKRSNLVEFAGRIRRQLHRLGTDCVGHFRRRID